MKVKNEIQRTETKTNRLEQPSHSDDFANNLSDNKYLVKIYYSGKHILKVEYQE
jgi:hypothetical protein